MSVFFENAVGATGSSSMVIKGGAADLGRRQTVTRVKIALGLLAAGALTRNSEAGDGGDAASDEVLRAIRLYLRDKTGGGPTWAYPAFLDGRRSSDGVAEIEFSLDESLWRDFEREAATQEIEPERLLEHAIFYYAAELDAGRVTERILAEFDEEESR